MKFPLRFASVCLVNILGHVMHVHLSTLVKINPICKRISCTTKGDISYARLTNCSGITYSFPTERDCFWTWDVYSCLKWFSISSGYDCEHMIRDQYFLLIACDFLQLFLFANEAINQNTNLIIQIRKIGGMCF